MKCSGKNEVVIGTNLVQAALVEGFVVDEATGLVNDDERKHSPSDVDTSLVDIIESLFMTRWVILT